MEHWAQEFEHASVTADNRESFNTAMGKFPTVGDAAVGYMELQKTTGKPFKVPESMANLPDDASRTDFSTQAFKALGIEHAGSIEDLVDLDLKMGMAEGSEANEEFANSFKQFVVDKKISKANAQELLSFYNTSQAAAVTAYAEKQESDRDATAEKVNAELAAHPDIGSKEELEKQSELFKRAIKNRFGLTAEESDRAIDGMIKGGLTTDSVLARIMLKAFAPLAAEGATLNGEGGDPPPKIPTVTEQLPATSKALNWT